MTLSPEAMKTVREALEFYASEFERKPHAPDDPDQGKGFYPRAYEALALLSPDADHIADADKKVSLDVLQAADRLAYVAEHEAAPNKYLRRAVQAYRASKARAGIED